MPKNILKKVECKKYNLKSQIVKHKFPGLDHLSSKNEKIRQHFKTRWMTVCARAEFQLHKNEVLWQ